MALTGSTFHSLPIIQHLARNTRQSPPPSNGSGFEYVDAGLKILARSSVTKDEYEARHALQDKALRAEFQQQRRWTDQQSQEQRVYMDGRFEQVHEQFEEQRVYMDGRFEQVDLYMARRFEQVDKQFKAQRTYIDQRFELVNQRFEKVDERFDRLEARFDQMEGRVHNSLVVSSWDEVYPVGSFNPLAPPGSRFRMPEYFPNRVVKFWKLKEPRNVKRLSALLGFFNTQGFQRWGAYDMDSSSDDSDSDESSVGYRTLEVAVRSQPEIALRALATHLGLNYDRVAHSMKATESVWQGRKAMRSKRTQHASSERPRKQQTIQTIPTTPPVVPKLTMEELMKEKSTTKSPSIQFDQLGWANSFTGVPPQDSVGSLRDTGPYAARESVPPPEQSSRRSQPRSRNSMEVDEKSEGKVATSPSLVTTEEIPESERRAIMERHVRERRDGSARGESDAGAG